MMTNLTAHVAAEAADRLLGRAWFLLDQPAAAGPLFVAAASLAERTTGHPAFDELRIAVRACAYPGPSPDPIADRVIAARCAAQHRSATDIKDQQVSDDIARRARALVGEALAALNGTPATAPTAAGQQR